MRSEYKRARISTRRRPGPRRAVGLELSAASRAQVLRSMFTRQPHARGHIQISISIFPSDTVGTSGVEVEGCAIGGQCRPAIIGFAVHGLAEIHRCGPEIKGGGSRRDPQINLAKAAWTIRGNEHLQAVATGRSAGVRGLAAELWDKHTGPERSIGTACARVDGVVARPISAFDAVEVNGCGPRLLVREAGRSVLVQTRWLDVPGQFECRLPCEVIIAALPIRAPHACT